MLDTAPLDDLLAIAEGAPGRAAGRPGDHRAGAGDPSGRPAAHRRAGPGAGLVAWPSTTSAPRRCRWPSCRCCGPRSSSSTCAWCRSARARRGRRDHERGQRPRRAHRRAAARRGHRDRAAPDDGPGARRAPRAGLDVRPAGTPARAAATRWRELHLPPVPPARSQDDSPVRLPARRHARCAARPRRLLIEVSKQLERQAMRLGETCVVAATFQEARHFTPATAQRYRDLVARTGFVCALGEDLPVEPVPGVRGAALSPDDPVRGEWDVTVVSPHFAAALLARDLGDTGPDVRAHVRVRPDLRPRHGRRGATHALLSRVVPAAARRAPRSGRPGARGRSPPRGRRGPPGGDAGPRGRGAAAPGARRDHQRRHHRRDRPARPAARLRQRGLRALAGLPRRGGARPQLPLPAGRRTPTPRPSAASARRCATGAECRETLLNYRGPGAHAVVERGLPGARARRRRPRRAVHRRAERRHRPGRGRAGPGARARPGRRATWPGSSSSPSPTR